MSKLSWHRRGGVHIGSVLSGHVDNERERNLRLRTYHVQHGDGYGRDRLSSKFYVRHKDMGMEQFIRSTTEGFGTLAAAKAWAQAHLVATPPRMRYTFAGRNERGELQWVEGCKPGVSRTLKFFYAVPAEEFYEGMTK